MATRRRKYRLAMLDDTTLREVFHIRVSTLGAISVLTLAFVLIIVSLSLLIVYTPIRNILPGYSASLRQQLIDESARIDSLQSNLLLQRQYLEIVKQVAAGDIPIDSLTNTDSLQLVERTQILEQQNSEVTETFIAQYEQKERDRLMLFDNTATQTMRHLYRPVRGTVIQSVNPNMQQYGVSVRTATNENVMATTRGTIVAAERMADNTFTVVLQNGSLTAVYRHLPKMMKTQGIQVEKGEVIGVTDGEHNLVFELWDAGQWINPEEVIVW